MITTAVAATIAHNQITNAVARALGKTTITSVPEELALAAGRAYYAEDERPRHIVSGDIEGFVMKATSHAACMIHGIDPAQLAESMTIPASTSFPFGTAEDEKDRKAVANNSAKSWDSVERELEDMIPGAAILLEMKDWEHTVVQSTAISPAGLLEDEVTGGFQRRELWAEFATGAVVRYYIAEKGQELTPLSKEYGSLDEALAALVELEK